MSFHDTMEQVVRGFEVAGVAILVLGSLVALVSAAAALRRGDAGQRTSAPGRTSAGPSCWAWRS